MPVWVLKETASGELKLLMAPAGRSPTPPEGWELMGVATLAIVYELDEEAEG